MHASMYYDLYMMTSAKTDELEARLADLQLIANDSYLNAGWDRQHGLDKLKREVENAYDNMEIAESDYTALQIAIKGSY